MEIGYVRADVDRAMVFSHDVFLSHSTADKPVVRALAERLRRDGLRVWLDEWELRPGDSIPARIEEGLAGSRILVLCMSAAAFGSDWARLESQTFQFRDPLNRERRFIPLRLDDTEPKGSLAQFLYVDWRAGRGGDEGRDKPASYAKLIEACQLLAGMPGAVASDDDVHQAADEEDTDVDDDADDHAAETTLVGLEEVRLRCHTDCVTSVALSADGRYALSGSRDKTVRLWEVAWGHALGVFEGHTDNVTSVALSADGRHALSGSLDQTVRLWEVATGRALRVLEGHTGYVTSVALSADGQFALSGSLDHTIRLWELASGRVLHVFEGHTAAVTSVALGADGRHVLSGSRDATVRLWDVASGHVLAMFEGHTDVVTSVALSADGRRALSGSTDHTVRSWDVASGRALGVFEGHIDPVTSVALGADGRHALSGSLDRTVRLCGVASRRQLVVFRGHAALVTSVALGADGRHALSGSLDRTVRLWELASGRAHRVFEGHTDEVTSVALSADGQSALSGSRDRTVRLLAVASRRELAVFLGHTAAVTSVALSADGRRALSGSRDRTVRIWEVASGDALGVLEGHTDEVTSVAVSGDGRYALSGSRDRTVRFWEVASRHELGAFQGHTDDVTSVALSAGGRALSGSRDNTVRLWDIASGQALGVLEGHTDHVTSVALSADGRYALSGSLDHTVRLWEVASGRSLGVFEGHTGDVTSVAFRADGRYALSGSLDHTIRLWELASLSAGRASRDSWGFESRYPVTSVMFSADGLHGLSGAHDGVLCTWRLNERVMAPVVATPAASPTPDRIPAAPAEQLQYTNAKVLLVGDSGAGKTGLSMRLAENTWRHSDSTVGAWATQWRLGVSATDGVEREIWLWDFGGQADQRLVHQLFMEETRLAVLVFDPQKGDLFDTLGQWDRDLARATKAGLASPKLLVAGRVDAGGLQVARGQLDAFVAERGFVGYVETSAKTGAGCDALRDAIMAAIRWDQLPWRSSPLLFKRLKDEVLRFKDEGRILMRFKDLRDALVLRMPGEGFRDEELEAVLGLLEGPGVVWKLAFGSWVLLQPERVNAYAQAVIQTVRADRRDLGTIAEDKVLRGELAYQSSLPRLAADDERIVLLAMHQILVERGLCLREHTQHGTQLVFPSFYRRERPDVVGHPAVFVSYRFDGSLDEIYATLVVRLHHAESFKQAELWRYAADFETLMGKRLGVKLMRSAEGAGELEVYFDPDIAVAEQIIFSKLVHEHLFRGATQGVVRLRHYVCRACKTPVGNREVAMARLAAGKLDIVCASCEARVPLWDDFEQYFARPEVARQVQAREEKAQVALDSQSNERVLVGEVISAVALAGQISRELPVSDHGIDMEIELTSDTGEPSGKKLYLLLRSGDAQLRQLRDREVFMIHDERQARYWMKRPFPVMLVVRSSTGDVRWMEIRAYLLRMAGGEKIVAREIYFVPERFDVMSIRRWRDRALGPAGGAG